MTFEEHERRRLEATRWIEWQADIDKLNREPSTWTRQLPWRFHRPEPSPISKTPGVARRIVRSDGEIYPSIKDAADSVGTTHSTIRNALRGRTLSHGYRWYCYQGIIERTHQ
jgi:hypothetical protein